MKYDFETIVNRSKTGSLKWSSAEKQLGKACTIPPLSTADMEFVACPSVEKALIKAITNQCVFGYTGQPGGYSDVVIDWLKKEHTADIEPEWIFQTSGVIQAIHHIVTCFTNEGDGIIVQTPVYHQFMNIINHTNRTILENPLNIVDGKYCMDYKDLEEKAKQAKMILLCSPHNPVGRVWNYEELLKIKDIAIKNNLIIVADEIHFDFTHGKKHTVFTTLDKDHTILCTSPSKTFNLAGLNFANIIIPNKEIREKLQKHMDNEDIHMQTYFGYYATMGAYSDSGSEWKNELNETIENNFVLVKAFFNEKYPTCYVSPLEGTYLAWIDLSSLGYKENEILDKLVSKEIFVDKGSSFGTNGECFIRMNLACPTVIIKEVLKRFETCLMNK